MCPRQSAGLGQSEPGQGYIVLGMVGMRVAVCRKLGWSGVRWCSYFDGERHVRRLDC